MVDFVATQHEFSRRIRDPKNYPLPEGVTAERMKVYEELFYNNVEGFLASGFPVLKEVLPESRWYEIVRDFFVRHHCETPFFLKISEEFLDYLETEFQPKEEDPGFIKQLAHYEWLELALDVSTEEIGFEDIDRPEGIEQIKEALLSSSPAVSPLAHWFRYDFPVHTISGNHQPQDMIPDGVFLIVYRNLQDQVGFVEINQVTARLLQILKDHRHLNGRQALMQLAAEMEFPDPGQLVSHGQNILLDLLNQQVILGTYK